MQDHLGPVRAVMFRGPRQCYTTDMKNQFTKVKLITAASLIIFGATARYFLQGLPNIETITVVSLLAGSLIGGVWAMAVGLIVVASTDILIGNTAILLYTWSAWAGMGLLGYALKKRPKKILRHSLELTGMGVVGNVLFFLWTNFGVWQIGGLYPHTMDGLILSYVMGLPFLRMQLIGTLVIVPVVSVATLYLWSRLPQWVASAKLSRAKQLDYARDSK